MTKHRMDPTPGTNEATIQVDSLTVGYTAGGTTIRVLDDVSFEVGKGEFVAIVGESGSGKSMTCLAIAGLLPSPVRPLSGSIGFGGHELTSAPESVVRRLRGREFSMIFQDPLSSLNPTMRVGRQIAEPLLLHRLATKDEAAARAMELLATVGFQEPAATMKRYPHELSGGMRQRVAIAAALACVPKLLIADEPTSALDATVQSHVLGLLKRIQQSTGVSVIFVTHDLRLAAHAADRIVVMYAGRVVEVGPTEEVLKRPRHAYTRDLLSCTTTRALETGTQLARIPGTVPDLANLPSGCAYHPRCRIATAECARTVPDPEIQGQRLWHCHHPIADGAAFASPGFGHD
jgi:peptide/nickel transport system ATP-binding protein